MSLLRMFAVASATALVACSSGEAPTGVTSPPDQRFQIAVQFVGSVPVSVMDLARAAAARWEDVLAADVPDVTTRFAADQCAAGVPAFEGRVDDLLVFVRVDSLDGPGRQVALAGPCVVRAGGKGVPVVAVLSLDVADLASMTAQGLAGDLVLHEMGHALGVGTLWAYDHGSRGLVTGLGTSNPRYVGPRAVEAARSVGVLSAEGTVPVEGSGGVGTADLHWRESVLTSELMTGYLDASGNALSRITVEALADLGYAVNAARADAFPVRMALHAGDHAGPAAARAVHDGGIPVRFLVDAHGVTWRVGAAAP